MAIPLLLLVLAAEPDPCLTPEMRAAFADLQKVSDAYDRAPEAERAALKKKGRAAAEKAEPYVYQHKACAAAREGDLDPRTEAALRNKRNVRAALSVWKCVAEEQKAEGEAALHHEQRTARVGGVLDMREARTQAEEIVAAKDDLAEVRADMKEWIVSPLECRSAEIEPYLRCLWDRGQLSECPQTDVTLALGYFIPTNRR